MWGLALALGVPFTGCAPEAADPTSEPAEAIVQAATTEPSAASSERGGIGSEELLAPAPTTARLATASASTASLAAGVDDETYQRRVLAVTDVAVLRPFTLKRVLDQLVVQAKARGAASTFTSLQLFQQFWDIQNPRPGRFPDGAHCDDPVVAGTPPFACRFEGQQANENPFVAGAPEEYVVTGLTNRFDVAPTDGATCGEARVVFARRSGLNGGGRSFIIFEAELKNPTPSLKLQGCRRIMEFWNDLAAKTDLAQRAALLEAFYFNGLPASSTQAAVMPVVHIDNYGVDRARATGQIRTNQFLTSPWMLKETRLDLNCATSPCKLRTLPQTVKVTPSARLFAPNPNDPSLAPTDPLALEFQRDFFPTAVAGLSIDDMNRFDYVTPEKFNLGESHSQRDERDDLYSFFFGGDSSFLGVQIQNRLRALGRTNVTPTQVVNRALALSCAGCHQLSSEAGDVGFGDARPFPFSAGFVHITEFIEFGPEGERFQISPAMTGEFLPHRQRVLASQLTAGIKRTTTAPVIDGNIDSLWSAATTYPMDHAILGTVSSTTDLSATWRALFDANNLYLLVQIKDDVKKRDSGNNLWDDDGLEIYIDANDNGTGALGTDDFIYRFVYNDTVVRELTKNATTGVTFKKVDVTGGYRVEIKLPWSTLKQSSANRIAGGVLGLDLHLNDDDNGGTRDGKLGWWARLDQVHKDATLMGPAQLRD